MNTAIKLFATEEQHPLALSYVAVNALVNELIRHTKTIGRTNEEAVLLMEENALALEIYQSMFPTSYIHQCATIGADPQSFIVRNTVPMVVDSDQHLLLRLRSPLPFPIDFIKPNAVPESHEWVLQFKSLVARFRNVDQTALIVNLCADLEVLRDAKTEDELFNRASELGIYVRKAIENMRFERAVFLSTCRAGTMLL